MLYVLSDLAYLAEQKVAEIRLKAEETRNLTLGLIRFSEPK